MFNKLKILASLLLIAFLQSGCEKILEPQPVGTNTLQSLTTTYAGITSLTNGMYTPLYTLNSSAMPRLTDLASDDGWTWRNELESDIYIVSSSYQYSATVWTECYKIINYANNIIDNIPNVSDFPSDAVRNSVNGQALFMRAYSYFNLVRLFGGVPLIKTQVTSRSDAEKSRATIAEVYALIKEDLNSAITLLPTVYSGTIGQEKGRPTSYAASALIANVYLELEEWDNAISAASSVIGNGSLLTNYADNFNGKAENGAGSLFEIQYNNLKSSPLSSLYASPSLQGSALILPTDDNLNGAGGGPSSGNGFVQTIESGDLRRNILISTYGLQNFIDATKPDGSLYLVNKFYNTTDAVGQSSWNFPIIRYADVLLAKSEALNEKSYVANGDAFALLNQIRNNAGLALLTSTDLPTQVSFRDKLRHERRVEFAFEGKRFFDLNRWGLLQSAIQPQLTYLKLTFPSACLIDHPITGKKYYLYPIPQTEFINNANLGKQNPGY